MSLRLGALEDALLDAGAAAPLAQHAAEEVAAYEARMQAIERDLSVLKWMVGVVMTLSVLIVGLSVQILSSLP